MHERIYLDYNNARDSECSISPHKVRRRHHVTLAPRPVIPLLPHNTSLNGLLSYREALEHSFNKHFLHQTHRHATPVREVYEYFPGSYVAGCGIPNFPFIGHTEYNVNIPSCNDSGTKGHMPPSGLHVPEMIAPYQCTFVPIDRPPIDQNAAHKRRIAEVEDIPQMSIEEAAALFLCPDTNDTHREDVSVAPEVTQHVADADKGSKPHGNSGPHAYKDVNISSLLKNDPSEQLHLKSSTSAHAQYLDTGNSWFGEETSFDGDTACGNGGTGAGSEPNKSNQIFPLSPLISPMVDGSGGAWNSGTSCGSPGEEKTQDDDSHKSQCHSTVLSPRVGAATNDHHHTNPAIDFIGAGGHIECPPFVPRLNLDRAGMGMTHCRACTPHVAGHDTDRRARPEASLMEGLSSQNIRQSDTPAFFRSDVRTGGHRLPAGAPAAAAAAGLRAVTSRNSADAGIARSVIDKLDNDLLRRAGAAYTALSARAPADYHPQHVASGVRRQPAGYVRGDRFFRGCPVVPIPPVERRTTREDWWHHSPERREDVSCLELVQWRKLRKFFGGGSREENQSGSRTGRVWR
eukprot:GHVU01191625.1.p1 GENE.GHVU01191625.1~~GHVU01191625.1.p1  ORF type:complete len:573 (+),score=24.09 GHVU01191625.1:442-2160(+)